MNDIVNITAAENEQLLTIITKGSGASVCEQGSSFSEPFPLFIIEKIKNTGAVIAVTQKNIWVGYFYLQLEEANALLSGSGLSVVAACRVHCVSGNVREEVLMFLKNKEKDEQETMVANS